MRSYGPYFLVPVSDIQLPVKSRHRQIWHLIRTIYSLQYKQGYSVSPTMIRFTVSVLIVSQLDTFNVGKMPPYYAWNSI
jgi:hypothetical protein